MRTTQTTIQTKFGLLHVDVLELSEGYLAKVDERYQLPGQPRLTGPLAATVSEAVVQLETAVARLDDPS